MKRLHVLFIRVIGFNGTLFADGSLIIVHVSHESAYSIETYFFVCVRLIECVKFDPSFLLIMGPVNFS